ncbi:SMC-Scp complex subunit ScpB [Nesterenkonia sp. CL21]|uniref:SMC-Scp complex subunit ScpB n=1 Tax=Nesterenkonia sp. CL21 TaxID=3064894 RepID=UPI0028798AF5|nr:SMC-Scp complex subunit ScpB [Nesterenkonia sp. CL21]MDS2172644.1 SMC-Scp complex subunit ScpB [Nesterenkonia sp. CL21]
MADPEQHSEPGTAPGVREADPALESSTDAQLVAHEDFLAAVEAVLMVTEEPVTPAELAAAVKIPEHQVVWLLDELRAEADGHEGGRRRGYELREVAGGWRYYSRMDYADQVSAFVLGGQTARLSQAALETLAIIAYRQPVARSQVAAIRGVNVDGVVRTLVHRGLIDTAGTDPVTGATLYTTTRMFLEKLGVDTLEELPQLSPHLPGVEAAEELAEDG